MMGAALLDAGKAHEAARCFEYALETMPGNPEYQAGLTTARLRISQYAGEAERYRLSAMRGA
jgi:hypothetical protein